jgi:hypothetical protein
MRKTVYYLVGIDMPKTFDELRVDERVKVAAVALDMSPEKIAWLVMEKRAEAEKAA